MSKNSVKQEAVEPIVTERTSLSGPKFRMGGSGPAPCSMKLSSRILGAAGLRANDQIQLTASDGAITIRKIGDRLPGLVFPPSRDHIIEELLELTRLQKEAEKAEQEANRQWAEENEDLNEEQRDGEEL